MNLQQSRELQALTQTALNISRRLQEIEEHARKREVILDLMEAPTNTQINEAADCNMVRDHVRLL